MFILKHPNGKIKIGEGYSTKSLIKAFPGSVEITRGFYHATNSAPTNKPEVTVFVNTDSYSIESQNVSVGYSFGEYYDMYADVYMKDDQVKIKISFLNRHYDDSITGYYYYSEEPLAVAFPTGSNSSLDGFELITRITLYADYTDDGGYLLNLEKINDTVGANRSTTPFAALYTSDGSSITVSTGTTTRSTYAADLEFDYLSNSTVKTINDIEDTVSDLSSESASKFVSR